MPPHNKPSGLLLLEEGRWWRLGGAEGEEGHEHWPG